MKMRIVIYILTTIVFVVIILAGHGGYHLYTCSDRLDLIESLQADNANMKLKIGRLENSEYGYIIQQLPPIIQDELGLLNERIRQERNKR